MEHMDIQTLLLFSITVLNFRLSKPEAQSNGAETTSGILGPARAANMRLSVLKLANCIVTKPLRNSYIRQLESRICIDGRESKAKQIRPITYVTYTHSTTR